jgi:hypothetical protein
MDNVQNVNTYINIPVSQTSRSYLDTDLHLCYALKYI